MSITIIRPKDRQEWLQQRGSGIGSSDVGTILGLNPYETPYQLWRLKKHIDAPKEENFAMKAGHYLEDAVSKFWSDATGKEVVKSSAGDWLIVCNENPVLRVSPDRIYWLSEKRNDNKGILECKTTQKKIDEESIPMTWFSQVQYQLGVSEMKEASLAWLSQGRDFGYIDLKFVPEYYEYIVENVMKFWNDCILGDKEPDAINAADVIKKYAQHTEGKIVEVTSECYNYYTRLKDVKNQIKLLEEQQSELENNIQMSFADAEAITYQGHTLATWKTSKASQKFDSGTFKKENPDMAAKYTIDVAGTRRFLVK